MIQNLKEHMNGSKTDEPFFCGIGLCDKNVINQHMINHVEGVLKEDMEDKESRNEVIQKLAESDDETKSNTEPDKEEKEDDKEESSLDDSDLYAGFHEDGNRIVEDDHDEE